ncbi:FecR protein [Tsuneonella dongtanensis]|uniref:FecR protein n=1 Tax=Tsuneonella dongtanensis TaxID=692370 RepID=A0A1B2AGX6_9SPHN|nr:FecR domain-containing protein [Tsuneonella dongtanensis]ANY21397.1 FecR protein [Tsuneonella dongtanensis]
MRTSIVVAALAVFVTATPVMAEVGRIKSHVGDVSVQRGNRVLAATPGFQLDQGDVIVTGKTGRVGIAFLDNTRMALGPNSRIRVNEFAYDRAKQTGSFVTSVDRGSLGVVSGNIAKSKRDAMRVRTPTSMLGVRGTRFVVEVK